MDYSEKSEEFMLKKSVKKSKLIVEVKLSSEVLLDWANIKYWRSDDQNVTPARIESNPNRIELNTIE